MYNLNSTHTYMHRIPLARRSYIFTQKRRLGISNMHGTDEDKLYAAHNERNQSHICNVLLKLLPKASSCNNSTRRVLEVACGTGQHAAYHAANIPDILWCPTDIDKRYLRSVAVWTRSMGNVEPPRILDLLDLSKPAPEDVGTFDSVYCCNCIHISPSECTSGLLRVASKAARVGGRLFIYGPFKIDGAHISKSNADFDMSLRARDPSWGIRNIEDVDAMAKDYGFEPVSRELLPANNYLSVWEKKDIIAKSV